MTAAPGPLLPDENPTANAATSANAVVFRCLLDDQPGYLAPPAPIQRRSPRQPRLLNPRCRFSWLDGTPPEVAEVAVFLSFEEADPVVWVQGPTGWHPFWLGAAYRDLLAGLRPGVPIFPRLPAQAVRVLRDANILVGSRHEHVSTERFRTAMSKSARSFRRRRYVNVPGLMHPFHVDALRKYYRRLIRVGGMYLGDGQTSSRYARHNEPVSRFFHHQLTPAIREIVGEPVKPTYTYAVSYQGGSELEKHVDREQCEFSLSLLVDYPPERERNSPWPLCLESRSGTVAVTQSVGDALLFCGRDLPHFRPTLPVSCTSTSLLFHYVREDFAGTLD